MIQGIEEVLFRDRNYVQMHNFKKFGSVERVEIRLQDSIRADKETKLNKYK